jgi:arabinofuranosyltransferase
MFGPIGALLLQRSRGFVVPLGAVVYLGVAATWDWATGGLENGLALAWLGATFWAVTVLVGGGSPSRPRLLATAALAGVGVLVRPDFVPFCLGFLVPVGWVAWQRGRTRALLVAGLAAVALPLAVQMFRMGYYGGRGASPQRRYSVDPEEAEAELCPG